VPAEAVRVIAYDVGGNFKSRNRLYPEFAPLAWAYRRMGRPEKNLRFKSPICPLIAQSGVAGVATTVKTASKPV